MHAHSLATCARANVCGVASTKRCRSKTVAKSVNRPPVADVSSCPSPVPTSLARDGGSSDVQAALPNVLALWGPLSFSTAARADEAVEAVTQSGGVPWPSILLALAPLLLYSGFYIYREQVNKKAKIGDFVSIVAGAVIVANIVSILAFKVRLF